MSQLTKSAITIEGLLSEIASLRAQLSAARAEAERVKIVLKNTADRMGTLATVGFCEAPAIRADAKKHCARLLNEGISEIRRALSTATTPKGEE